jgi:hypothetical protein
MLYARLKRLGMLFARSGTVPPHRLQWCGSPAFILLSSLHATFLSNVIFESRNCVSCECTAKMCSGLYWSRRRKVRRTRLFEMSEIVENNRRPAAWSGLSKSITIYKMRTRMRRGMPLIFTIHDFYYICQNIGGIAVYEWPRWGRVGEIHGSWAPAGCFGTCPQIEGPCGLCQPSYDNAKKT